MPFTAALAGNPNCGKTTLFNKLTGASQRVGNWPGVTIDKKVGRIRGIDGAQLVDTPGIYSLSPYSPEEMVTRNFILEENPDVIINIVDATNIERNLFLTLQIIDTGVPTVVALNMMDAVEKNGGSVDIEALESRLGCPVVAISALRSRNIDGLVSRVAEVAESAKTPVPVRMDDSIESLVSSAAEKLSGRVPERNLRWYAVKLIENDPDVCERFADVRQDLVGKITTVENDMADEIDAIVSDARYNAIVDIVGGSVSKGETEKTEGTFSDKVDRIVTHRILGIPIFLAVLSLIFFGIIGCSFDFGELGSLEITGIGTYLTDLLNDFIAELGERFVSWAEENGVNEILTDLVNNAIFGGVGAVIGFLPQMLILFLALCILEDIGYMARIAFVMDRVFRFFGLSGKSLIPVIVGTGCGVPGIMASRTIESERAPVTFIIHCWSRTR